MYGNMALNYLPVSEEIYLGELKCIGYGDPPPELVSNIDTRNMPDSAMMPSNDDFSIIHNDETTPNITMPNYDVETMLTTLRDNYPSFSSRQLVQHLHNTIFQMRYKRNQDLDDIQKQFVFLAIFQGSLLLSRFTMYARKYSSLHNMFMVENLSELQTSVSPQIAFKMFGPLNVGEPLPDYSLTYKKIKFDLKEYFTKLPFTLYDCYDTFDRLNISKENQIARAIAEKHNMMAFEELKNICTEECLIVDGFNSDDDSHDPDNSVLDDLNNIINSYGEDDSEITHIAMGMKMFEFLTRVHPSSANNPTHFTGQCRFPGIPTITAVVDPLLDAEHDGRIMYAINKMNAIYGQGPIVFHSNDTNTSTLTRFLEFFQYKIIHKDDLHIGDDSLEFAFKINIVS